MKYRTKIVVSGSRDDSTKWPSWGVPSYPSTVKIVHQIDSETIGEAFDNRVHGMIDVCEQIITKSQKDGYAPRNSYYHLKYNSSWQVHIATNTLSTVDTESIQPYGIAIPLTWGKGGYSYHMGLQTYEIGGEENKNDLLRGFLAYAVRDRSKVLHDYVYKINEKYFYKNIAMLAKKEQFIEEFKTLQKQAGNLITGELHPDDQVSNFSDRNDSAVSFLKKYHKLLPEFEKPKTRLQKMFTFEPIK